MMDTPRHRGKFTKKGNVGRYIKISKKDNDHSYSRQSSEKNSPSTVADDLVCVQEETCKTTKQSASKRVLQSWRGRQVVDVGVLADNLTGCQKCGQPLHLRNCHGKIMYGLACVLKVKCLNGNCLFMNNVPTGKKHDNVWDANRKLAGALQHTGIGYRQLNGILGQLNIPLVSKNLCARRLEEVGCVTEMVAENSLNEALSEEVNATDLEDSSKSIVVSVDGAWQKRGSGRSYDSLSGHCSMIGTKSGKVVSYSVRNKFCKICDTAIRKKEEPLTHKCKKNWTGSSKGMESDMVVEMVDNVIKSGINIDSIVCDDDAATMSRIHQEIDNKIKKVSDKNHIKKNLSNSLYQLQGNHKISTKIIKYIQKSFNYMISQNKGNPAGVENGLAALSLHPFGDHSSCSESWCLHKRNPKQKYTSLPYGRPLANTSLQDSLTKIFNRMKKHSKNLAMLGSTQANESFNSTVAQKAPKHKFFSKTIGYRVAASVAQKNMGHSYLMEVNKRLGLSPGENTSKLSFMKTKELTKRRMESSTVKYKLNRLKLKEERRSMTACREVREGSLYKTEMAVGRTSPPPHMIPEPKAKPALKKIESPVDSTSLIFFDLETTGLGRASHITQIAAIHDDDKFMKYVIPKKTISASASKITGLRVINGVLFHNNKKVDAISISNALNLFLNFISKYTNVLLVGHNVKGFDCSVLLNALFSCSKTEAFHDAVLGFLDTKPLFKLTHPNLVSYSQQHLCDKILNHSYDAHDALEDVEALQILTKTVNLNDELYQAVAFTFQSFYDLFEYSNEMHKNLPSLMPMVEKKVLSLGLAKKIAGSGLNFECIVLANNRCEDGIHDLFTEKCFGNSPRVTKSNKIIDSVKQFVSSLCPTNMISGNV